MTQPPDGTPAEGPPPESAPAEPDDGATRIPTAGPRRAASPPRPAPQQPPQPPQWQPPPPNLYSQPGSGLPNQARPGSGVPGQFPGQAPPSWQPPPSGQPPTPTRARPMSGDVVTQDGTPGGTGSRRGLLLGGVAAVVLLLVAGAVAFFAFTGSDSVQVSDLQRGDCLRSSAVSSGTAKVSDLAVVDCDSSHDAQVIAGADLSNGTETDDACAQAITDDGTSIAALSVDGQVVKPLSSGDSLVCLVVGKALKGSLVPR